MVQERPWECFNTLGKGIQPRKKKIQNTYVWIFQNGVEFEAKLFRVPAGNKAFAVLEKAGGGLHQGG